MKKIFASLSLLLLVPGVALATPSTTYWTPFTPYIQPFGVAHLGVDLYDGRKAALPSDYGFTIGVLPFEKIQMEIGVDALYPSANANPFFANAKIGTPEGALFENSPGISVGIMNAGFQRKTTARLAATNYDILQASIGKTIDKVGTISIGGYLGNEKMLLDPRGEAANMGIGASYYRGLNEISDKLAITGDYMSGHSGFGGGGGGLVLWPAPTVGVIIGYVHFVEPQMAYGAPKKESPGLWTVQVDMDFDLKPAKKEEPAAVPAAEPAPAPAAAPAAPAEAPAAPAAP